MSGSGRLFDLVILNSCGRCHQGLVKLRAVQKAARSSVLVSALSVLDYSLLSIFKNCSLKEMDKLEFIKIKNFCSYIKATVEKKRIGKPLTGENICTTVFEKGFVARIHTYIRI